MSTAVAVHSSAHHNSTLSQSDHRPSASSPRQYAPLAPAPAEAAKNMSTPTIQRHRLNPPSRPSSDDVRSSAQKSSPLNALASLASRAASPPPPIIKKERQSSVEPPQPTPTTARHRPRALDLSASNTRHAAANAKPSAPLTASKESAGLNTLQDVGLACLSPGFQTHDPAMQHQLQRSMDLREQQRQIIEQRQRLKDGSAPSGGQPEPPLPSSTFVRTPTTSNRRKGPPPGLSIHAPSASHFSNEPRVVQSAPLGQSFTGLKPSSSHVHPLSRQVLDNSHRHNNSISSHQPPRDTQSRPTDSLQSNRLPPIHDVFAAQGIDSNQSTDNRPSISRHPSGSSYGPPLQHSPGRPMPSPGLPPPPASAGLGPPASHHQSSQTSAQRAREYKSAEEAVRSLSGGREDLLPRIVHYGGHQPPTPPSPLPPNQSNSHLRPDEAARRETTSSAGRRRTRDDYERDYPESHFGWEEERRRVAGPFGAGRDSPESQRRKKEEFLSLCSRAWELFHS